MATVAVTPPAGTVQMFPPRTKAMVLPSHDQAGALSPGPVVICSPKAPGGLAADMVQMEPLRTKAKAVPSGDQTGAVSDASGVSVRLSTAAGWAGSTEWMSPLRTNSTRPRAVGPAGVPGWQGVA